MNIIDYVITFESTHYAIMVEKKLKESFKVNMIPTPREITASCGLSIKFSAMDYEKVILALEGFDKKMYDIYSIVLENNNKVYSSLNI